MAAKSKGRFRFLLALSLLMIVASTLCGCRYTDALTEIIYTQDAEIIDYDNPTKVYIPVQRANVQSEVTPPEEKRPDSPESEREQSVPDAPQADDRDDTLSRPDVIAGSEIDHHEAGNAAVSESNEVSPSGENNAGTAPGQDQGGEGNTVNGAGNAGDASADNARRDDSSPTPGGPAGKGTIFDARNGETQTLPKAERVVACGDLAGIAATLGGSAALAGGPASFVGNAQTGALFGGIPEVFSGDGMAQGSANLEAIIGLKPDAVLVEEGCEAFTEDDIEALNEAGIDFATLASGRYASGIRACVDQMGQVLTGKPGPSGMSPRQAADKYLAFFDRVMGEALGSHGGTYAISTFDSGINGNTGSPTAITLLVDGWDDADVTMTCSLSDTNVLELQSNGVAFCNVSTSKSAVTTFLSAGGAADNLMYWNQVTWLSKEILPVLQYNENFVSYSWSGGSMGISGNSGILYGGGDRVLTNAASGDQCLGQDSFRAIIARSRDVASELTAASGNPNSIYYPGQALPQGIGRMLGDVFIPMYSVGGYEVYVNPSGITGNWMDGGMESVLESTWAAWRFSGYSEDALRGLVSEYYSTFYGKNLSNDEITNIIYG